MKHIQKFEETLNEKFGELRFSGKVKIISDIEEQWLKGILESYNQEYGFDPKDKQFRDSIYSKLGI